MNKTLISAFVIVALVIGAFIGFVLPHSATFGAVTPYNCLNSQILCNELTAIAAPLSAINQTTTAAISFPSIATSTVAYSSATTTAVFSSALPGDAVLIGVSTSTGFIEYTASVSATGTVQIVGHNESTSAITPSSTTFTLTLLPKATFVAPSGL